MSGALQAVFQNQRRFTTVPGTPTVGTATKTGVTTATVTFTQPASNGGTAITQYRAISTPDSITATLDQAGSGTISMTGLNGATSYTFTVRATNSVGNSAESSASNSITTDVAAGQAYFGSGAVGTFSWVAPVGVTSVSAVAVGCGGMFTFTNGFGGGGGGASSGGVSAYGGNGGTTGGAGVAPSGGGGRSSGAGARGECRVWI